MTWVSPPTLVFYPSSPGWRSGWLSSRDIRISSRIGLSLEAVSVAIILVVSIAALETLRLRARRPQASSMGASISRQSLQAIVFAIFSLSVSRAPPRSARKPAIRSAPIPKAIILDGDIAAGIFFVFTTYVITQGFTDDATKLGASGAPLGDILAGQNPLIIAFVYFGAAISTFACALASINAFGRTLFSLGRYQFLHSSDGTGPRRLQDASRRITFGAIINFVAVASCSAEIRKSTPLAGTARSLHSASSSSISCVSICAPVYLKKTGD